MKKLILLLSIITICYACKKETVEPKIQNSVQQPQNTCPFAGVFIADSIATINYCIANSIQDTVVHLTAQVINTGDTLLSNLNTIRCKYRLDPTTELVPYLSYSTVHNYNFFLPKNDAFFDTIVFLTKSNKTILMVKQ